MTDGASIWDNGLEHVRADVSRDLERELAAERRRRRDLETELNRVRAVVKIEVERMKAKGLLEGGGVLLELLTGEQSSQVLDRETCCKVCGDGSKMILHADGKWVCHGTHRID